jgi:hypothetical protein
VTSFFFIPNNIYYKVTIIIYILISVLITNFIEMTTVFQITLRPILILFKSLGLIDISYTVEPTGIIVRNMNSTGLAFFELLRMIILLICTYLYWHHFNTELHVIQIIDTIKFWIILIATRLSTFWITKYLFIIIMR